MGLMKFRTLILVILIMITFLFCNESIAYGEDEKSLDLHWSVSLETDNFLCMGPGDLVQTSFFIENKGENPIKLRLCRVENVGEDMLFDAMQVRWTHTEPNLYGSWYGLLTSWKTIPAGSTDAMELEMYMPKELGNSYQNKKLDVLFVFQVEGHFDKEKVQISVGTTGEAPYTGDKNVLWKYIVLLIIAVYAWFNLRFKEKL